MTAEELLADLARVWVARWTLYGGGLVLDADDKLQMSMSEGWRSKSEFYRHWHDGWMVGRWRELSDLASAVPSLRDAIKQHIAINGWPEPGGRRVIYGKLEDQTVAA